MKPSNYEGGIRYIYGKYRSCGSSIYSTESEKCNYSLPNSKALTGRNIRINENSNRKELKIFFNRLRYVKTKLLIVNFKPSNDVGYPALEHPGPMLEDFIEIGLQNLKDLKALVLKFEFCKNIGTNG